MIGLQQQVMVVQKDGRLDRIEDRIFVAQDNVVTCFQREAWIGDSVHTFWVEVSLHSESGVSVPHPSIHENVEFQSSYRRRKRVEV